MLNGTTVFSIPNIPKDTLIVPINVLFAYIYDAVVSGKGMFNLQITPSKNKTVVLLLSEKFPPLNLRLLRCGPATFQASASVEPYAAAGS